MSWAESDAEAHLESLELFGWRLGLERIEALTEAMGRPQDRFDSIHVVGTNGKSSVARMTRALLAEHGLAAGAYLSPHLLSWRDRILIGSEELSPGRFAAAVERAAEAGSKVEDSLPELGPITQFETLTAAALWALAEEGVEVAVIEAGLGGRLDATNVIPSSATVLTSVALDHTEWLGERIGQIAEEKVAVLREGSVLVRGRLPDEAAAVAERVAAERGAAQVKAAEDPGPEVRVAAPGRHQRRNFALALAATEQYLARRSGAGPRKRDAAAIARVAASLEIPGRMQLTDGDPPMLLDVAHNPEGAAALAEALPEAVGGRPVVGCLAVLADKDAEAMVREIAPRCELLVCTEFPLAPGRGPLPAGELAALCEGAGDTPAEAIAEAGQALRRTRELARERGGVALVAGSHYLLAHLWTAKPVPSC